MNDDEQITGTELLLRFLGAFFLYFCIAFGLGYMNITSPWIHVLVLLVIYMVSTTSPKTVKRIWAKRIAPLIKDDKNEQG